jgi:hypothetical protein
MEFKNKNREEISRLVSDRQAYISSLELKLEKFTQSTSSYLDIKEKLEKLSTSLSSAEEKIQGLSWLIKTQNENHQQQIKLLTSRYEDLQTNQMTCSSFPANRGSYASASNTISSSFNSQLIKDLHDFISMTSAQVKNEVDQRLELLNSKQVLFMKSIETKVDSILSIEGKLKEDHEVQMMKLAEKSSELQKDFLNKLENSTSLQTERYKELAAKINCSGQVFLTEEISAVKIKLAKIEDLHKTWTDQEVRRELEVKEASQAAWNVENLFKGLEKQVFVAHEKINSLNELKDDQKINYLAASLKKYVALQKKLFEKVEKVEEQVFVIVKKQRKPSKTPDSDRSLGSARGFKQSKTPKGQVRGKNNTRSRIDVLYDELTKMVRD